MTLRANENDVATVRSTAGLAHDHGLMVVAAGLEDHVRWDMLERLGCDIVAGYYVSRPLPAEALVGRG